MCVFPIAMLYLLCIGLIINVYLICYIKNRHIVQVILYI